MSLKIRKAEAGRLAEQVTALTGETKALAVTRALRDRLDRLRNHRSGQRLADELDVIARRCASLPVIDDRSPEEILGYDQDGVAR